MTPLTMISGSRIARPVRGQEGIALFLVLMIVMVVGVMAMAAVAVSGNARLITAYEERQDALESVADAGLELARAQINGRPQLYPSTGYAVLENEVEVFDATGNRIPGVRRSTYAGPTGVATGQFGVYGSIVSVARAPNGDRVVRRGGIRQESFAKYAYFTNVEPSDIRFGGGDVIQGPVHSNDFIRIYDSGATFRGPGEVTTAETIVGRENATFVEGYSEEVTPINMPQTAELAKLRVFAQTGSAAFTAPAGGNANMALIRIEFVAIDLDDSGAADGLNEGFFRVYRMNNNSGSWLMASRPGNNSGWAASENCGVPSGNTLSTPARRTGTPPWPYTNNSTAYKLAAVKSSASRCYLGGAEELTDNGRFDANDGKGSWLPRTFSLPAGLPSELTNRDDFEYLFPIGHDLNPNFKGVIHVTGRVAVSGTVRGKVTLAATDDIFIVDDLKYATAPGSADCTEADILGLFGGSDVIVADNTINTPQQINTSQWYSYDDTKDEYIQAVVLALNTFHVQNYNAAGPTDPEACEARPWGRGCLYLTGGIIQETRGGVGTSSGLGYIKRYAYDVCAYQSPPPYFPTTGHFGRAGYFEVDPNGFSPGAFFERWNRG